ncbi:MAG: hypothetical protein PUG85_01135 [Oscillospiraceae bacterium]|nr:hypothetical protein [Oscillospiraceae bacterium]
MRNVRCSRFSYGNLTMENNCPLLQTTPLFAMLLKAAAKPLPAMDCNRAL